MERRILIGIFRPKHVDNFQKWSRIFRSEETKTDLSIWIPNEISRENGISWKVDQNSQTEFPNGKVRSNC